MGVLHLKASNRDVDLVCEAWLVFAQQLCLGHVRVHSLASCPQVVIGVIAFPQEEQYGMQVSPALGFAVRVAVKSQRSTSQHGGCSTLQHADQGKCSKSLDH